MFGFFKKKIQPTPLIGLVDISNNSDKLEFFQAVNRDIDNFVKSSKTHQPQLMMPIAYAHRLSVAGLYHQGLRTKSDFDIANQSHFTMMAHIGNDISKEEQVEFQKKSWEHAIDFIKKYDESFEDTIGSVITASAKRGTSIYEALYYALIDNIQNEEECRIICRETVTPQFCRSFIYSYTWDPINDDLPTTAIKVGRYYKELYEADTNYQSLSSGKVSASEFENIIEDAFSPLVDMIYDMVSLKILNEDIAYQFILEELEGAAQGNEEAQKFVEESPFTQEEYKGAMSRSTPLVDGPDGPQLMLTHLLMDTSLPNPMIAKLRIRVVKKIIDHWFKDINNNNIDLDYFL